MQNKQKKEAGVDPFKIYLTRFGEILPFWQYFQSLRQLCEGIFSVWQKIEPALGNILCN